MATDVCVCVGVGVGVCVCVCVCECVFNELKVNIGHASESVFTPSNAF